MSEAGSPGGELNRFQFSTSVVGRTIKCIKCSVWKELPSTSTLREVIKARATTPGGRNANLFVRTSFKFDPFPTGAVPSSFTTPHCSTMSELEGNANKQSSDVDIEKAPSVDVASELANEDADQPQVVRQWHQRLMKLGVETRGSN
jgi:hypothetical protein